MKKNRNRKTFFKITLPNGKKVFCTSKNGWAHLIDIVPEFKNEKETFISQITYWDFIKSNFLSK